MIEISTKEKFNRAFICYTDDNGNRVDGYYSNVEISSNYLSFDTSSNRLILPWNRILKVKTELGEDHE